MRSLLNFQGNMLNFCDFIQVFVFTTNHNLNAAFCRMSWLVTVDCQGIMMVNCCYVECVGMSVSSCFVECHGIFLKCLWK